MEKIDVYNCKERLETWKAKDIEGISEKNAKLIRDYIYDMERGINGDIGHKGQRSPIRLLSLASRMKRLMELTEQKFKIKDITKLKEGQAHDLFLEFECGKIRKANGELYTNIQDYIKRLKSFWHWYMKKSKKEGKEIPDITIDLTAEKKYKAKFVYFTKEQLEKMLEIAGYDLKMQMLFMFDTGIRSPTELMNVRVSDISPDFKELNIREETSKTFGRRIKLMLCSDMLKKYIQDNNFSGNDLLFTTSPSTINAQLKKIGSKVIGKDMTLGRSYANEMTMYDFRHSSACFWLPKYKSRSALLYRFGWKREEEIHYYTELLGMKDTIAEEDMLSGMNKTELEKELIQSRKENERLIKIFLAKKILSKMDLEKIKNNE